MVLSECNPDGAVRYVTSMRESFDGLQFEVLLLPGGEILARMVDEEKGYEIQSMKLKASVVEEGMEAEVYLKVEEESAGEFHLTWDDELDKETNRYEPGTALGLYQESFRKDLMRVVAWWMAETGIERINVNDEVWWSRGDEEDKLLVERIVGQSQMDAFYGGEEVVVHSGMSIQATCSVANRNDIFFFEMVLREHGVEVAHLFGHTFTEFSDGSNRLIIAEWESNWDGEIPEIIKGDLLALAKRFLLTRFDQPLQIIHKETEIKISDEDMAKRTEFWLGF